jgi:hypothetical protein
VAAVAALCVALQRVLASPRDFFVDVRLIAACFAISLLLFALGGQGRFFYATSDWQVRDAVLHDLVSYPWPFAYSAHGDLYVLRAPIAFYLLPALAGKLAGLRSAELAMLAQSAAIMTCILSLGAGLFDSGRKRIVALLIFIGFSGMDVVGTWLVGGRLDRHLEGWSVAQFSSTITLAYWVPMHALAGWIGALLYLLWRIGRLPLRGFLLPLPLLALWSPLALLGALPFAAFAGFSTMWSRTLRASDVVLPSVAVLLSAPALLYLSSAAGGVAPHVNPLNFPKWTIFEAVEAIPFLLVVAATRQSSRFGSGTIILTSVVLLALPWGQLGSGPDIPMRASIVSLAILSIMVADLVTGDSRQQSARAWRGLALVLLLIGSVTPLSETWRALVRPRPALRTCSYFGVVPGGAPTYVAPVDRLHAAIAPPTPVVVRPSDPTSCRELDLQQMEERYTGA